MGSRNTNEKKKKVIFFVGAEREENLIRNDTDKSEFMIVRRKKVLRLV